MTVVITDIFKYFFPCKRVFLENGNGIEGNNSQKNFNIVPDCTACEFCLQERSQGAKGLLSTCRLRLNPKSASVTGTNSEMPEQIDSWQSFREQPLGTSDDSFLHLNCE